MPKESKSRLSRCRYWIAEHGGRMMPSKEKAPELEAKRNHAVFTHDLVEWSFQIACGMNYLTKRKVLLLFISLSSKSRFSFKETHRFSTATWLPVTSC